MRRCAILLLLACAGCGAFRRAPAVVQEGPVQRACRTEAAASPLRRELDQQSQVNNATNQERLDQEKAMVEGRAFTACLRRQGLASPGGVEPIRAR